MATPEGKVKDKVKRLLKDAGFYFFMPPMNGYGSSGVPDIIGCKDGRFLAVECKANGNGPTALQEKHLKEIVEKGGTSFVVDETGVGLFTILISTPQSYIPGTYYDFTTRTIGADSALTRDIKAIEKARVQQKRTTPKSV